MVWDPCCCTKCTHCSGSTPRCLVIEVSGVTKGGGSANHHLELNGYYPVSRNELSGNACLYRCSRMYNPDLWTAFIYTHSGNYYLGVSDSTSTGTYSSGGNPDPPFVVNLGTAAPNCFDEFVDLDVPYSAGWHSRHSPAVNNAVYSGATVTVGRYKDGMSCWCLRRGHTQVELAWETVCVSPFVGWLWQTGASGDLCYAGKYPWGGIRIVISGTAAFNGTYDFVGPPCVIEVRGGGTAPSIGWLVALPSTIVGTNFLAFMLAGSPAVMSGRRELRFYATDPRQTNKGTVAPLARRYPSGSWTRECLDWDGTQLLNDGDTSISGSNINGTYEVSALTYP